MPPNLTRDADSAGPTGTRQRHDPGGGPCRCLCVGRTWISRFWGDPVRRREVDVRGARAGPAERGRRRESPGRVCATPLVRVPRAAGAGRTGGRAGWSGGTGGRGRRRRGGVRRGAGLPGPVAVAGPVAV